MIQENAFYFSDSQQQQLEALTTSNGHKNTHIGLLYKTFLNNGLMDAIDITATLAGCYLPIIYAYLTYSSDISSIFY